MIEPLWNKNHRGFDLTTENSITGK